MDIDSTSGRIRLLKLMPDVTIERIRENTDFELIIPSEVGAVDLSRETELDLIREEIDPQKVYFPDN